ncbi:MAG: glycine cleavage system protein GcvH [Methylotenera sp.]|nr:glycine cleavage system protein GcvH [Oligoflexia bacterium]
MSYPNTLKYTKDHEWAKIEGKIATIGITDHAQSALGDVVFVELPAAGRTLKHGETFGVVESIKAVSDLYAPLDGKVLEANAAVSADPSLINRNAHDEAWLIKLEMADGTSTAELMDAEAYTKYVQSLK